MSNSDVGTFDVCALEHFDENKNDANTNAVGKLTMVSASGLTPEIMMKQCEENMARLKEWPSNATRHTNKADRQVQDGAMGAHKQTLLP